MSSRLPLLQVRDLAIEIGGRRATPPVVRGIDFHVARGEVFALIGPNGAGKSLVAHAICGQLAHTVRVTSGTASLVGADLPLQQPATLRHQVGRAIGVCAPARLQLSPTLTIAEQLTLQWRLSPGRPVVDTLIGSPPDDWLQERLQQVQVSAKAATLNSCAHQLSAGVRRRILLALAWTRQTQLLIVDAALSDLDSAGATALLGQLRDWARERQTGVLLLSAQPGIVLSGADRVGFLTDGSLQEKGRALSVLGPKASPQRIGPARRWSLPSPVVTARRQSEPTATNTPALLRAFRLCKFYQFDRGPFRRPALIRAVQGVSLQLYPGQCLGIVGESGSGKTTLARLLIRATEASLGRIVVDEDVLGTEGTLGRFHRHVQFVPQDVHQSFNLHLTVEATVEEPLLSRLNPVAPAERAARVTATLAQLGLSPTLQTVPLLELSQGEVQLVALARALCRRPRLLVLDEPFSGLAPTERLGAQRAIAQASREHQISVVYASHDLEAALQMSSYTLILHSGSVVESGPSQRLRTALRHPYSRALFAALPTAQLNKPRLISVDEPPDPADDNASRGCGYRLRCASASALCAKQRPALSAQSDWPDHHVACWHPSQEQLPAL